MQKTVFRRQLALGVSLGLPIVLHVRDAEQDALDIAMEVRQGSHGGGGRSYGNDECVAPLTVWERLLKGLHYLGLFFNRKTQF